jgi:methylthioribose-1-phosphate isomerase
MTPTAQATAGQIAAVRWDGEAPVIIDQRVLPAELLELRLDSSDKVVGAIRSLAVRGAPAIGITGGYGLIVGLEEADRGGLTLATLDAVTERIGHARPTATNLWGAVSRVRDAVASALAENRDWRAPALAAAQDIEREDREACASIGDHGRRLLAGRRRILTHCNTGRLATGGDGTALAVAYALHAAGDLDEVIATESRPLLQGGRLTAWELGRAGVPHRLIVDSAAGAAMASGLVEAVVVGCDRVAANGDTANKIGTYTLAVLARHHGVPFYVCGPLTTFDPHTARGSDIEIEERDPSEVRGFGGRDVAPASSNAWNPAFDVTPAELIEAFITDVGVLRPPYGPAIATALARPG